MKSGKSDPEETDGWENVRAMVMDYGIVGHMHAAGIRAPLVAQVTCVLAPLQIEGTINGTPFYFRTRFGGWRCSIAGGDEDPVLPASSNTFSRFGEGELSIEQACHTLAQVFNEFLSMTTKNWERN